MKINIDQVANLARLNLTEEEKKLYGEQLSNILDHAEELQKLNTDKVAPTSHAIPMKNVFREDKAIPCKNTKDIMANAPEEQDHMFKVPRIIEE
ncbi:asparaginyl/glutamyl-tRNA amidotransferase subunit C [candidate division WOR-1 bacterium RIFOXYA12_FULL_43_27]|uniref:Aspartyl/glutamyl-tRNA(Asn/Gln) amidotransferase subunit C n=1 Tax=candidate division WOR-1 bacterium RIFOXYC2_FULL_46_14 TaxID=1802587 RepID=A0A1F4U7W9_UNCSA|nr:MAG: asparaginyl/glutamyl-tRNA amidotransferase subunit C [candidate division WOR-1 bacterium RIFOXYA12_FULL_43_27]OGC19449.1 MAG: asparaginyl/glutamyl-tRNA amidotransferase subunit C [candidate division WOR-1 bacterium RIFOXYB2_FULL_46_45]OGC30438.1 MAG: asparaginyl/glutamyl-tRNA amidotransferase subunit C [candidate division WOR-1 bacterium RIFOXYA2_FULL_46_56]OGC41038.1 MAG: asparaginyl/glutamyl-tRNA amidotransferase subunit C [candidate division WOR-1 bacterium RIFOXYC2_FULL_46_14]